MCETRSLHDSDGAPGDSESIVIRLWLEELDPTQSIAYWRGQAIRVKTGRCVHLTSLADISRFVASVVTDSRVTKIKFV